MSSNTISWVLGPSHVLRWASQIRSGTVKSKLTADRFIGIGGAPIWSKRLFDTAHKVAGSDEYIGVVVGDFRFGNAIALLGPHERKAELYDGFLSIDSSALDTKSDQIMLDRGLTGIRMWDNHFGQKARYLFWCLFCRQVQDRLDGRYIDSRIYRHPTFNYSELSCTVKSGRVVDLSPLLKLPMHEIVRLFIDSSCHPSIIGYRLIENSLISGEDVIYSYNQSVADFERDILGIISPISDSITVLSGRSVWLNTLVRILGASGSQWLAQNGLIIAPLDIQPGRPNYRNVGQTTDLSSATWIIFSHGGEDLSPDVAVALGVEHKTLSQAFVIDWENSTIPIIENRSETPNFLKVMPEKIIPAIEKLTLSDHMVELGPAGIPTWAGIEQVLELICSLVQKCTHTHREAKSRACKPGRHYPIKD